MLAFRRRCADTFGVTEADLIGRRRVRVITHARQASAYAIRLRFGISTPCVAFLLGGLCHTTVVYACQQVEWRMQRDAALAERIAALIDGRDPLGHDAHVQAWRAMLAQRFAPVRRVPESAVGEHSEDDIAALVDPGKLWCDQCDASVPFAAAARCRRPFCGIRRAA
jgi:hypothetical protein